MMKKHSAAWRYGIQAVLLGMMIAAIGLGCSAPNNTDQTVVIERISATPGTLQEGGQAVVEVRVTNSRGEPLSGVEVMLAVDPPSRGVLTEQVVTTGVDGTAATVFTAITAGAVTLAASHEKASMPQYAWITVEEGSATAGSIVVSVNPGLMAADASSQSLVTCRVYDGDGNYVPDETLVRFVAGERFNDLDKDGYFTQGVDELLYDNNDNGIWDAIGELDNQAYTTSGVASVDYTAGTTATTLYIKATAFLSGGVVQNDVSLALSADGYCLIVEADPRRIRADGISAAALTLWVCDAVGEPVDDNTAVKLTVGEKFNDLDKNGYWSQFDELVIDYDGDGIWDPIGAIDSVAYTVDGAATVTYTAGTFADTAYIKVSAGAGDAMVQKDIAILLLAADSIASINLTPSIQRTQVRGTGGIEWSIITATGYDSYGNRAPQDLPIDFTINAGPGGGENLNGDPVGPVRAYTDDNGEAVVTFNSGIISGTARIRASAGTVVSEATQVAMISGPPAYVTVGADDCNVPSWELVNETNEIVAVVNDEWGNECADSTAVHFWTEQGTIEGFDGTHIAFTERGLAVSMWKSSKPKDDGFVYYWAETEGGQVADTGMFLESGLPATTTIMVYPTSLLADGLDKGRVVVSTMDVNNVYMDTDYPIELRTTYGTVSSGLLGDGCHSSYYETELFSQTFTKDYSYTIPDDGVVGVSLLEAIAGGYFGAYDSKNVIFESGAAYVKSCEVEVESTIPHNFTVPVAVIIKDRYNNPLGGHQIVLSSETGVIAGNPQYTDAWGVASGFTYTTSANFAVEVDFLYANDLDPGYGGISITKKITVKDEE